MNWVWGSPHAPILLARHLGKLARPCAEILASSAPAGDALCCLAGMFSLCLLAFLRCSSQSCTALPLVMEICWAAPLGSAGVLCMQLSLHTCRLNTPEGHGSITKLHPPHSWALPSPPHRLVYCALPSEAGLPSPQHSPLSFLASSNPHLHPPSFLLPRSHSLPMDGTGGHC